MSETFAHYCGGYECDNPATIEVLAGKSGGMLGWICEDCADELEQDLTLQAAKNQARLEREVALAGEDDDQ